MEKLKMPAVFDPWCTVSELVLYSYNQKSDFGSPVNCSGSAGEKFYIVSSETVNVSVQVRTWQYFCTEILLSVWKKAFQALQKCTV
jgi:hypothetical protein